MDRQTLTLDALAHFTGADQWFRHGMSGMLFTSGVEYMAKRGGAYWLIDAIASHQRSRAIRGNPRLNEFQVWTLKVNPDRSAVLTCQEDTGSPPSVTQRIEYTDFALPQIKLYVEGNMILLPSEH